MRYSATSCRSFPFRSLARRTGVSVVILYSVTAQGGWNSERGSCWFAVWIWDDLWEMLISTMKENLCLVPIQRRKIHLSQEIRDRQFDCCKAHG